MGGVVEAQGSQQGGRGAARRPYEKPRILLQQAIETVASVCTPAPPAKANLGSCPAGPLQT